MSFNDKKLVFSENLSRPTCQVFAIHFLVAFGKRCLRKYSRFSPKVAFVTLLYIVLKLSLQCMSIVCINCNASACKLLSVRDMKDFMHFEVSSYELERLPTFQLN